MTIFEKADGKYCIVFDKIGNCATFFGYQANLCDFDREILKVSAGSQEIPDALEKARASMIWTMRGSKR